MTLSLNRAKKILILGDSGRGKTTLAEKLATKLELPHYSTDDYYWKVKFTLKSNKEESITELNKVYDTEKWIVEGTTKHLLAGGLEKAEIIVYLGFRSLPSQYLVLTRRFLKRKEERLIDFLLLMRHILVKRYGLSYKKNDVSPRKFISAHEHKLIELYSYKEIDQILMACDKIE